jgi:hypothetical protein
MQALQTLLVLLFASLATTTHALAPDDVRAKYPLVSAQPCQDNESKERGTCFLFDAGDSLYMVFVQNGHPVFIRQVVPGSPYVEVWRARPPGEPT